MKKIATVILLALSIFSSCTKEDTLDLLISIRPTMDVVPGETRIKCSFADGKGPVATDKVVLEPSVPGGQTFRYPVENLTQSSFSFVIGSDFVEGKYLFCIERGSQIKRIGEVTYRIVVPDDGYTPAATTTVYGRVTCEGAGVGKVVVSDGVQVVATDEKGYYELQSKKDNGYVFISIPSGYEVASTGVLPQFYKSLNASAITQERKDFTLTKADQTDHTMLFFGDIHLAGRSNDRSQFALFTSEINDYLAANKGKKIYAMTLGDMVWDLYWYDNNYAFKEYLADVNAIKGLQIFHTIGNHDHDMNAVGDIETVKKYRESLCPNYYSFNVGGVHYVALDNIECTNEKAALSIKNSEDYRTYNTKVVPAVIAWLKKDLQMVSKTTPVVVTMHATVCTMAGGYALDNAAEVCNCFAGYDVTFITGHTHKVWTVQKTGFKEYNSGAVCATWWRSGMYYPSLNMGQDGPLGGYRVMEFSGTKCNTYYKAIGRSRDTQFFTYDRNCIDMNPAKWGINDASYANSFKSVASTYGYGSSGTPNQVIINVWDYNPSWKIEVTENGKPLTVRPFSGYDPLFLIAYTAARYAEKNEASKVPVKSTHIFEVTASSATTTLEIKVTDDDGRVYTETMGRPKEFELNTYK